MPPILVDDEGGYNTFEVEEINTNTDIPETRLKGHHAKVKIGKVFQRKNNQKTKSWFKRPEIIIPILIALISIPWWPNLLTLITRNSPSASVLFHDSGYDNHLAIGTLNTNGEIPQIITEGHGSSATIGEITSSNTSTHTDHAKWYDRPLTSGIVAGLIVALILFIVGTIYKRIISKKR